MSATVAEDLTVSRASRCRAHEASCPVTIALAAEDRLFPLDLYGGAGPPLVGGAEFLVLDDVGHVPMYDDPRLVADTIRGTGGGEFCFRAFFLFHLAAPDLGVLVGGSTSALPPDQPKTQETTITAKTRFQAVVTSCWLIE